MSIVLGVYLILFLYNGNILSENLYNTYTKQSLAWIEGRLDLGQNYEWLELAVFEGKYYVSFPPFPSYILLPFALIFGSNTPESLINIVIALVGVVYSTLIALEYKLNKTYVTLLPIFLYVSGAVFQITLTNGVWFIAQNMALTFSLMSIYYTKKGHKGLSLFLLCCATGCRPFQILYLPLIIYIYTNHSSVSIITFKNYVMKKMYVFIPTIILSISYLLLNYFRFGDIFEFGHNHLPEFTRSENGQFSLVYIKENFFNLFRLPEFSYSTRMTVPYFNGMNVLISFPILIWYLFQVIKNKDLSTLNVIIFIITAIHIILLLSHKTMGGYHYGNRYIIDIMPAIFLGICYSSSSKKAGNIFFFQALLLFGLSFNILGYNQFLVM